MVRLSDGWKRLREAVFSSEAVGATSEVTKAFLELGKTFKEEGAKLDTLKPLLEQSSSLLDFLCSPSVELLRTALPFIPVPVAVLKVYREKTHQKLNLEECIAIGIQTAYVASFQEVLSEQQYLWERWNDTNNIKNIKGQIKKIETFELDNEAAQTTITSFPDSQLAKELNQIFSDLLQQIGLKPNEASDFTERVTKNIKRYLFIFIVEADNSVEALKEFTSGKGIKTFDKYVSIKRYLEIEITPKLQEKVFNENFLLEDIYVKPKARKVDSNSKVKQDEEPFDLESWARELLLDQDPNNKNNVIFIQGGPGRGKSLFCRMFANLVQRDIYPRLIPILIRLRDLDEFQSSLEQTLSSRIKYEFAQNNVWLNDTDTNFLFILDGFDELRIEQKNNQSVERFIRQVGRFAFDYKGEHRVIITGRTMALHGIDRLPPNLARVEIAEMDAGLQSQWFDKWQNLFPTDKTTNFQQFLQNQTSCPRQVQELAKEPLLLYMLTAMHRDGDLDIKKFEQATNTEARILVYQEALDWVLNKQRSDKRHPDLNTKLTGQDPNALRRILAEAAVCVVQSGGESASMQMVKARLQQDDEARELIKQAEETLGGEALKTALGTFSLKSSSSGGVEFFHKSFREFLCAERLKQKFENWAESGKGGKKYNLDDKQLYWDIYDFLGYGGLTPEIVEYLMGLLAENKEIKQTNLFERLESFYRLWCDGGFIDSSEETLPQKKARELQKQIIQLQLGQRQVDIFAGLNIMILLLELNRYAQTKDELKDKIAFYPCGQKDSEDFEPGRLLRIISYSNSVNLNTFLKTVKFYLEGANLVRANLERANLVRANLERANLEGANLEGANLVHANLVHANLVGANLDGANLDGANLDGAYLVHANLVRANLVRANLDGAYLVRANLEGANLESANLVHAYLEGTNLDGANLEGANLEGAYLDGAYLDGARLISAKNLTPEQVKQAQYWERAKYDEEFRVLLGLPPKPTK